MNYICLSQLLTVGPAEQFIVHNIVQQESVCGGILCSASTGEVSVSRNPHGGNRSGKLSYQSSCVRVRDRHNNTPVPTTKEQTRTSLKKEPKKGKACVVSSMATMGIHAVETLLLLYWSLFLPVVLHNSQAWYKIT